MGSRPRCVRGVFVGLTVLLVAALAITIAPAPAAARRQAEHRYRFEQVWSSTIRLVRVDYGFPIRDRDEDIGFFLFDYVDSGRSHPGSVEVVKVEDGNQTRVRVVLNIPAMPSYIERMMLDKLGRKLVEDWGEPLPVPPRDDRDRGDRDRDDRSERPDGDGADDDERQSDSVRD